MHSEAVRGLRHFLFALFAESDIVEIRPIEVWRSATTGTRCSRVIDHERRWLTRDGIITAFNELESLNLKQRANIFMGVNPRANVGGASQADVASCRCLWADMDYVTPEVARWRCHEVGIPDPSIVVDSGTGVHLYWLLREPMTISESVHAQLASSLKRLYQLLGCDATSDLSRLLRLPGFDNVKDARNGLPSRPCKLVQCLPNCRFDIDCFPRPKKLPLREPVRRHGVPNVDVLILSVLCRLDVPVADRSRRDFGVVCDLIRLGLSTQEIWLHVAGKSKFATHGYRYFLITMNNAWDVVAAH